MPPIRDEPPPPRNETRRRLHCGPGLGFHTPPPVSRPLTTPPRAPPNHRRPLHAPAPTHPTLSPPPHLDLGRLIPTARITLLLCSPRAAASTHPAGFAAPRWQGLQSPPTPGFWRFISDVYPAPTRSSVSWMNLSCSRTTGSSSTSKDARHRRASLRAMPWR
uniref:Uncharacterized protein n=1 Tax=Triticum urartu TaxID=4572 RepID=A0A8R7VIT8_TRIUA